jgi:phosphohistidine phosphatase
MAIFKTLLVMRHAKSSWKISGIPDHERPLNRRGERDAVQMARFIGSQGIAIDRVAASTAKRAQQTATRLIKSMAQVNLTKIESRDDFYLAPPRKYLNYLTQLADSVSTVMLIGHNPGLESLVQHLSNRWEAMPTAAIAHFDVDSDSWRDADLSKVRLDHVWRAKDVLEHYR